MRSSVLHPHPARRAAAICVASFLVTISCATRSQITFNPGDEWRSNPEAAIRGPSTVLDSERQPIEANEVLVDATDRYELYRLSFPSTGSNGQNGNLVTVDYHRSTRPGARPVVVVLPIWGRYVYPSNATTRTIRKRSGGAVHVLNLLGPDFLTDWAALEASTDAATFLEICRQGADHEVNTIVDVRRVIDWIETRPEIDSAGIGLIGFSHSAIVAPTIAANDTRITSTVLVMGGALPHRIISNCAGPRMTAVQDHVADAFGWSRSELEAHLQPIFAVVDPANYPGRIDPASVLIIEAGNDTCIDQRAREALRDAMGEPERWVIDTTHKRAFLSMTPLGFNWIRRTIWDFFEERLLGGGAD